MDGINSIKKREAKRTAIEKVKGMGYRRKFLRRIKVKKIRYTPAGKVKGRNCFEIRIPVKYLKVLKIVVIDQATGEIFLNSMG